MSKANPPHNELLASTRLTVTYVLHIEFADDPPRVGVFDTLAEAESTLDAFTVTAFDPPQNDTLQGLPFRARIFECSKYGPNIAFDYERGNTSGWGIEIDVNELERRICAEINRQVGDHAVPGSEQWRQRLFANIQIPYVAEILAPARVRTQ
jgi:hypothetical protein